MQPACFAAVTLLFLVALAPVWAAGDRVAVVLENQAGPSCDRRVREATQALNAALEQGKDLDVVAERDVQTVRQGLALELGDAPRTAPWAALGKTLEVQKVAVLAFENHGEERYSGFVGGIADMLMTSLGQAEGLQLIERLQIEKALANFHLELSGPIDTEAAVEVGKWLGADAVVLGSFIRFGDEFRIDARIIDAQTGELVVAQNVRGSETEVMALVDQLGARLLESSQQRETENQGGHGILQVGFLIAKSEMGERPVYHHICKLNVDGRYLGTSSCVHKTGEWATLFTRRLQAGKHQVEVVHGYVKQGEWDGELPLQPRLFQVIIEPGATTTIRYGYEVGWFKDQYTYEHPWREIPR